jgi:hypothetical protein
MSLTSDLALAEAQRDRDGAREEAAQLRLRLEAVQAELAQVRADLSRLADEAQEVAEQKAEDDAEARREWAAEDKYEFRKEGR